jgi:RNA polymerase primary sigma factor
MSTLRINSPSCAPARRRSNAALPPESQLLSAAARGDEGARQLLIDLFTPRVRAMARRYRGPRVSEEELMQEGVVGLLRALQRYQEGRAVPFWTYAAWWVRQAMQGLVAELTHPVVLSDRAFRRLAALHAAQRELGQTLSSEPSARELAARTGLSVDHVLRLRAAEHRPRSLSEPIGVNDAASEIAEQLPDPASDDGYQSVVYRQRREGLRHLGRDLTHRERDVLRARYGLTVPERTLSQIAAELGLTPERVRQIQSHALDKLRAELDIRELERVA